MNFDIPRIHETIYLSDYAPEFGREATISVWVNPPRKLLAWINEVGQQELTPELVRSLSDQLATLWGSTREEVDRLIEQSLDTDPQLIVWLLLRTILLIRIHRETVKKNWTLLS